MSSQPTAESARAARAGRLRTIAALCAIAASLSLAAGRGAAAEPTVQLRVGRAPYYAGVPVELQTQSADFERAPQPECTAEPPASGQLKLVRIVPNFSSSVQIINGRVSKTETSNFTCVWEFTAAQPGTYPLGPFYMEQNGERGQSQRYGLKIDAVPEDPRIKLVVGLPDHPIYLGQRMPVRIELWLEEDLQESIRGYTIRGELFDREDVFRFVGDPAPDRGGQTLNIQTATGESILKAVVQRRQSGKRRYLVVVAERTLMPLREGEFALEPATLNVSEVTGWQRDLFGGRRPAETRLIFAQDAARTLVVKAPPDQDRPPSFAGAVGRGFSLDVTADRSVVQLGDPITLTLTIRGDGNLANVSLPRLEGDHGLSPRQFRLPEGDVSGEIVGDTKVFKLPVRVLDDAVREVPALSYSWFDPDLDRYQTSESRPIALSVRPAQVISAADVVSSKPEEGAPVDETDDPGSTADEAGARRSGIRGSFSLTGADLSLEEDPAHLLPARGGWLGLRITAYAGSLVCLGLALAVRRRAGLDPVIREQREVFQAQRKRVEAARTLPRVEALTQMAAAVREIVAVLPAARSAAVEHFLQECDDVIYSPGSASNEIVEPELWSLAEALLDEMQEALT